MSADRERLVALLLERSFRVGDFVLSSGARRLSGLQSLGDCTSRRSSRSSPRSTCPCRKKVPMVSPLNCGVLNALKNSILN